MSVECEIYVEYMSIFVFKNICEIVVYMSKEWNLYVKCEMQIYVSFGENIYAFRVKPPP